MSKKARSLSDRMCKLCLSSRAAKMTMIFADDVCQTCIICCICSKFNSLQRSQVFAFSKFVRMVCQQFFTNLHGISWLLAKVLSYFSVACVNYLGFLAVHFAFELEMTDMSGNC